MANDSDERGRAARLLIRVEGGAFASRLLEQEPSAGVRARLLGVLRWRRLIDHRLEPFLKRTLAGLDPEVRAALRLGVFEGAHLGVPAPVATDAMVRLVRRLRKSSAAGMVNAVLRRVLSVGEEPDLPLDLRTSHPEWIGRRWEAAFGEGRAAAAMAAAQEPAPPWVWFVDDRVRAEVVDAGVVLEAHPWCKGAWTAGTGRSMLMNRIADGGAVVQDPTSQLVAQVAVELAGGRGRALDLCAAPGGKTALMDRLGDWSVLAAADRSPAKAHRLSKRLPMVAVLAADAAFPAVAPRSWDLVLLDAPCSGTGTFRRHPELKWRLRPGSIDGSAEAQRRMIAAAVPLLAEGGVLVYSTCSVEPEENEAHFESIPDGCEPVDLQPHLPVALPWIPTTAGGVRILPHAHGDGFTLHAVRREG